MRGFVSLGAVAAALLLASPASASIVTMTFAGNLNLAYFGNATGPVSGTATYDTASSDPNTSYYTGVVTGFTLTSPILNYLVGKSTVTQTDAGGGFGDVHYVPDGAGLGYDQFEVVFYFPNVIQHPQINFDLVFPTGSIPGGYKLPKSLPPIAGADYAGVRLDDGYGDLTMGQISQFDMTATPDPVSSVPEPAGWALAILGFGGVGAALRRRSRLAASTLAA